MTALAILPDDLEKLDQRMASVLKLPEIQIRLEAKPGPFLVYFMPKDYVMQGMIADTGANRRTNGELCFRTPPAAGRSAPDSWAAQRYASRR